MIPNRTHKAFDPATLNFQQRTLKPVARAARITAPAETQKPCVWVVAVGSLQEDHQHLLAHYQTQATHAGYEFGLIEAGNDADAVGRLLRARFTKGKVLLINTDAPHALVTQVQAKISTGDDTRELNNGGAVDANHPMAWHALAPVEARPLANRSPTPWTVAQLEAALSELNQLSPSSATPPSASIRDDIDLSLEQHEDVATAIQQMKQAGLLDAPSDALALKLSLFANDLEMKRAAKAVLLHGQQPAWF